MLDCSIIQKSLIEQISTAASTVSPKLLESKCKRKQWEEKFINYSTLYLGSNGIPLSYVIRTNDNSDIKGEYPDFITWTIAYTLLKGEFYTTDKMTIFNILVSFTTSQPSADWIKPAI